MKRIEEKRARSSLDQRRLGLNIYGVVRLGSGKAGWSGAGLAGVYAAVSTFGNSFPRSSLIGVAADDGGCLLQQETTLECYTRK